MGNVCRSPVAERYLLSRLGPGADVRVSSAGLRAFIGHPIDPPNTQALRELGGDELGHTARNLDAGTVLDADLILAATIAHRAAVLRLVPAALRRTFATKEFVRLGGTVRPAGAPPPRPTSSRW